LTLESTDFFTGMVDFRGAAFFGSAFFATRCFGALTFLDAVFLTDLLLAVTFGFAAFLAGAFFASARFAFGRFSFARALEADFAVTRREPARDDERLKPLLTALMKLRGERLTRAQKTLRS
jgi:hypothetical protein